MDSNLMLNIAPFHYHLGDHPQRGLDITVKEDFRIQEGQKIVFTGRSGIGKTTFIKLILGFIDHPKMQRTWFNQKCTQHQWDQLKTQEIAFVSQHYGLIDHLNVLENILLPLGILGISKEESDLQRALLLLEQVGLKGFEQRQVYELSQGEKQRVALSRALILNPKLLILDEPTAHLDAQNAKRITTLLLALPIAILIVSHDSECIDRFPYRLSLVQEDQTLVPTLIDQQSTSMYQPTEINHHHKHRKQGNALCYQVFYALKAMAYYQKRYFLVVLSIVLSMGLFFSIQALSDDYQEQLNHRAEQSALLMGKIGSRYDLLISSLYFKDKALPLIQQRDWEELMQLDLGITVPLYVKWTSQKAPIVATTIDYFEHRKLRIKEGDLFRMNGEVVVGFDFAQKHQLQLGDTIYSDQSNLYDLAATYPLKLKITGILDQSHSPDDWVVFCDLKTAWIIGGFAHGHQKTEGLINDASLLTYQEINRENIDQFHFHGDELTLPLSSILIFSDSAKEITLLKGKYQRHPLLQVEEPRLLMKELIELILQIKNLVSGLVFVLGVVMLLLMLMLLHLTFEFRKTELSLMREIGAYRFQQLMMRTIEISLIFMISIISILGIYLLFFSLKDDFLRYYF